jgi:hypothetical protein
MNQLTEKGIVIFKFGIGAVSATDFVTITNKVLITPDVPKITYSEPNGKLANEQSYVDEQNVTTKFDLEVLVRGNNKAGDALATPPKIADLLKSCGLVQTVVETPGSELVSYTPTHTDYVASNATVFLDDSKRDITGIRSSLKISGKVGEVAKITFSCQGFTTAKPTTSANPAFVKDKETLLLVNSVSVITVGGSTVNLESFEFDIGNDIKNEYLTESKEFSRSNFKPTLSLKGKKVKGEEVAWDDLVNGTQREIVITLGNEAGKTFILRASHSELTENGENDTDGKVYFDRKFDLRGDENGENHFELNWL